MFLNKAPSRLQLTRKLPEASGPQSASLPLDDLHHSVLGEAKNCGRSSDTRALLVLRKHLLRLLVGWALTHPTAPDDVAGALAVAKPSMATTTEALVAEDANLV